MIDRFKLETSHYNRGASLVIGVDEVGRGPLAGPVVAAAVSFTAEGDNELWNSIFDSKRVSEKKRQLLFDYISTQAKFGIGEASVAEIEELNILQASLLAMKRAVLNLTEDLSGALVLVDGKFIIPNLSVAQSFYVGGDSTVHSIAAASILAKVTRDELMKQYDTEIPGYNFAQHKGYGTAAHMAAIKQNGLSPIHRVSFCGNIV